MAVKEVLVFGSGIGALSAAHELVEDQRAEHFKVRVVGPSSGLGGKAISSLVPGDPAHPRGYPGEHGFRFFPAFYRHVVDTMSRIPSAFPVAGRSTVAHHLRPTPRRLLARTGHPPITFPSSPEFWNPADVIAFFEGLLGAGINIKAEELVFFVGKLIELARTPKADRILNLETQSWWQYIGASTRSEDYQRYLATGLTHTLVAADPKEINAKTGGDVLVRILIDSGFPVDTDPDRVLDGPTSRVWIEPWKRHLVKQGVEFIEGRLDSLTMTAGTHLVEGARVVTGDGPKEMRADYFVCGLPVEAMADVLMRSPTVTGSGQRLSGVAVLRADVRSMTGLQFYLDRPLEHLAQDMGHHLYVDSDWALTAIQQSTFWQPPFRDLARYGDGSIKAVLSVIISNWKKPYAAGGNLDADHATRAQIKDLTIQQLIEALNGDGVQRLLPKWVRAWALDSAVTPGPEVGPGMAAVNTLPLLVNHPNRWRYRPDPAPAGLDNLLLASDYVRTNTDLATMEAANEAARRAVNAILARENVPGKPCAVFELYYPEALASFGLVAPP
jgi:hypothetical protein